MTDIVRTQILSRRWENLWTLTPFLHFEEKFKNLDSFRNFVNRSLLSWRGEKIQIFKITSPILDKSSFSDMNLWVRFAVDNGVELLHSTFSGPAFINPLKDNYRVTKCLYSCSSLRRLSIFVSGMEINGNVVQWNHLKTLKTQCFWITLHAIDLILSGSPILEVFILIFGHKDSNFSLSFRSTSLKMLYVHDRPIKVDIPMDTELRIWTPNLEKLLINGSYGKCLLMDVSSLTCASISFTKVDLGATLCLIFLAIRHVERLTLSDCCIKVFGSMAGRAMPSPCTGVTHLSLNIGSFQEHDQIVGLLECFPKLKTLAVREDAPFDPKSKNKFKPNPSKTFLEKLRLVKITWRSLDSWILPLIEIMLKYASKLEMMAIQVKATVRPSGSSDFVLLALELQSKVLGMPRSSPNAKLIFREY